MNAEELNPSGRPLVHDFLNAFVKRYSFLKYPQKPEDINDSQGVVFESGKWNDIGIEQLILFDWGVVVDTRTSTDASEALLQDVLKWGAENFGLSNRQDLIKRKTYVSELIFASTLSLPTINENLKVLASKVNESIGKHFHQKTPYEFSGFSFHFDTSQSKQFFSPFRIERLEQTPFSDNKYYSGAPLQTAEHVELITELETLLVAE